MPRANIGARFGSPRKPPGPSRSSPKKRLNTFRKEDEVWITNEEVDWRGIVKSLSEENKELREKVVDSKVEPV